ncbi:hypothetical protein [Candidatus Uabimicrobium sp. HlEnr_7]|uniref:hypothetical protein n=1 Tax=Candidatus Uabimicrobium helgolandensis TaxID=3095367 RepID=UPI003557A922
MFDNLESLAIASGLFFTAYQLRQGWKTNSLGIELMYKERFDQLNQDRKDFHDLYKKQTSLKSLKKTDKNLYQEIINWENRYFHYEFDRFIIGHKRKAVPRSLKKAWDCSLQSAMQNKIHKQAWELEIRNEYFLDKDFYNFVDSSSTTICD